MPSAIPAANAAWLKRVQALDGPLYQRLVAALEAAVAEGELQAGDQLPPQRAVAALLGVDFTTITRAYALAQERGLVEGAVGRGTFVRRRAEPDEAGLVDLSMNLPPPPLGLSLAGLLKDTTKAVLDHVDPAAMMAYHPGAGSLAQRTAAAQWLAPGLGAVAPDRVLVCAGAQTALAAVLTSLARPGDAVIVEPLTYPGLLTLAAHLGLRLIACPVDDDGLEPKALERLCAQRRPKAIYLVPALQNPTTRTMGETRRAQIAAVGRRTGVPILEDDAYGRLADHPLPALARLAPEVCFHVATLAKALSPGLRIAFVVAPDAAAAERLAQALRAVSQMASPLIGTVVTRWIHDGVAEALLQGVRREAAARQAIAREILPAARGGPDGVHVWLDLPAAWDSHRLRDAGRRRGLALAAADAFAAPGVTANGLRISLGAPTQRAVLAEALRGVAALLAEG
ncbi:MAG: transcriptional regulator, GntR family with aminotransferase domain [Caulobacter sp.]|nr:transcriptional regulator, GntR family with aminotransferase domain [Caulobacter sp.]